MRDLSWDLSAHMTIQTNQSLPISHENVSFFSFGLWLQGWTLEGVSNARYIKTLQLSCNSEF